jgi:hypothetical protein
MNASGPDGVSQAILVMLADINHSLIDPRKRLRSSQLSQLSHASEEDSVPGKGNWVFSSRGTDFSLGTFQGSDMQRFFPLISPPVWFPPRSLLLSGVPFCFPCPLHDYTAWRIHPSSRREGLRRTGSAQSIAPNNR